MPLSRNSRFGQYEIVELLGAGGMGEVYRARDVRLERDVAIKVLPVELGGDQERLDRFAREARLLAQLSHTNIATIHGLEEHEGRQCLVMELVEGETLAERIVRGPIPLAEAVPLFFEIAQGLEAAHEKGIVHRDLKPSNIIITPGGRPKILDFGLATVSTGEASPADLSESPTVTKGTAVGVILGTAQYMSPEQAKGKPVDKRTDIWAFGCCLYEALTARKAFHADTLPEILAAILGCEPDLNALPTDTPPRLRRLLARCPSKDAWMRLRDIGDARIVLSETDGGPTRGWTIEPGGPPHGCPGS